MAAISTRATGDRDGPRVATATVGVMRIGVAIDLHGSAREAAEVGWAAVREQALAAERAGLDLVVLPDHLAYRPGGDDGYSLPDQPVGARESFTFVAALGAVTSTIGIGHSVVNAPYRTPAMTAHLAAAAAEISGGRYSLGIGVGNSFDYDQLGVAADHRVSRFEECVSAVSGLLRDGTFDLDGEHWSAHRAELTLRPAPHHRPAIVVAAGGPRTMRVAVAHADVWNGWCPTDPDDPTAPDLLRALDEACAETGRDPATIGRSFDLGADPLDRRGARARTVETLQRLESLGVDEVRCYAVCDPTATDRLAAVESLADLSTEL